jgi:hypothetical protein
MNFDPGTLEPLCFDPITIGGALLLIFFGAVVAIMIGVAGGAIGLTTVIISNRQHELTVGKLVIIGLIFAVAAIVVPKVKYRWFSRHLHPPGE